MMDPDSTQNMHVSELTEHDTQAIEASVVSSTPPIAETEDRVTHETRPTPTEPRGAQGFGPPDPKLGERGSKVGPQRARGRLASNKS